MACALPWPVPFWGAQSHAHRMANPGDLPWEAGLLVAFGAPVILDPVAPPDGRRRLSGLGQPWAREGHLMLKLATTPPRGVTRGGGYDWDAIMSSSHARRALGTIRAELDGAPNSQVPLGRAEAAKTVEALDRRLLANPQDVLAMAGRGFYLTYIGRHKEAILELDRAIALDPRCRMAHAYRGAALLELGLYGDALEAFELARSCSPEPVDHFNIGITLRLLDRKLEASRAIKMARSLDPKKVRWNFLNCNARRALALHTQ
ncbi:MAG: tetratricopeptide repeat protein [Gammaproteobacteria bacterium]|nr:tetratricopeptide repeat protein [Gammaproteobacteria bacterium]